jgi:predicted nucleic acid-binding protein
VTSLELLVGEVANALLTGIRRRRWSGAAADVAFVALRRLPIRLADDARDVTRAWDLARGYGDHPLYEMLYIAVAERTYSLFITADNSLRQRLVTLPWVIAPDRI